MRRRLITWFIIPAVWLFWGLALNSMMDDSPIVDEQNHLARGLAFIRTGDPRLSLEHPPLVNSISALPLLTLPDIRIPFDHPSWERQPADVYWYHFAEQLLWVYNHDVTRMVFLARLPIMVMTIGLALVGFHFARLLWGRSPALVAFWLILLDPNILAHGRYTTTDMGGTSFLFLAALLLWQMWQADGWNWRRWLWTALGLGLAFGSKLSTLAFVPIFLLMAVLPITGEQAPVATRAGRVIWGEARRRLGQLLSAGMISIVVVWAIFGFEWGSFVFGGESLHSLNLLNGPMPTFWAGLEQIMSISSGGRPAFLLGQFSKSGFSAYFPVAFLAKTPPVLLILIPVAAVIFLREKASRHKALFLLLPPVLYFLISMQSALNIGYRHLLPLLPFLYVLVSGLVRKRTFGIANERLAQITNYSLRITIIALLGSLLLADFAIHPHYLSYFNMFAGGPENGRNILIDSNIDWGQDLLRLRKWMAENEVASVKLGWFGTADPEYYDISYEPIPGTPLPQFYSLWGNPPFEPTAPEPGVYAISVTSLWELPLEQKYVYPWFRECEPDDRVGYSILIYEVP